MRRGIMGGSESACNCNGDVCADECLVGSCMSHLHMSCTD